MKKFYRILLYKLFTMPSTETGREMVDNTFGIMSITTIVILTSLSNIFRCFYPIDLRGNFYLFFIIIGAPSFIFNYFTIYHKKKYVKILKDYSHLKRGNLLYLLLITIFNMLIWAITGFMLVHVIETRGYI